jgi:hypothetical protein
VSPRFERLLFRLSLVGLVFAVAVFGYRVFVNPPGPNNVGTRPTTTTSAPVDGATTTTTTPSVSTLPPPAFAVTSPLDRTVVNSSDLTVTGIGAPTANIALGETQTLVSLEGVWSMRITLVEGDNLLTFTQTTADLVQVQSTITVTYEKH